MAGTAPAAPDPTRTANLEAVAAWTRAEQAAAGAGRWVAPGVVADREARCVTLAAEATGLERGATVEFVLIETASDRDYEALAVALAAPADIARALEFAGLPPGRPVNRRAFRFWPKGERVTVEFAPFRADGTGPTGPASYWVTNLLTRTPFYETLVYVGSQQALHHTIGPRGAANVAPGSIASTYNEPSTLLDVPALASQGDVYGNRVAGDRVFTKGELLRVRLRPEERPPDQPRVVEVGLTALPAPGGAAGLAGVQIVTRAADPAFPAATNDVRGAFERLAALARAGRDPFVALTLDDRLTVAAARDLALALSAVEGANGIRVDEPPSGQLYYKAFLPQQKWRVRGERLTQPWELRLTRRGEGWSRVLVEIKEDWSKPGQLDPDLTVVEHPFEDWAELPARIKALGGGLNTLFVFAPADAPLSAFMPGARAVHTTQPLVFVFAE